MNTIGLILEIIKASSYQQAKFDLNWNSLLLSFLSVIPFHGYMASRVFSILLELFQTCGCGRDNECWQWNLHLGDFSRAIWIPAFSLHVYSGERDKKQIKGCKHAREKEALSVQLPQLSCFLIKILIHSNWPVKPC